MDASRFDEIVRSFGQSGSRRRLLKGVAASLGVGLFGLRRGDSEAAGGLGAACTSTADCGDPSLICDLDNICRLAFGAQCSASSDCFAKLTCCNGACSDFRCCSDTDCPSGVCDLSVNLCTVHTDPCQSTGDCTSAEICDFDGICRRAFGVACSDSDQCFSPLNCVGGVCTDVVVCADDSGCDQAGGEICCDSTCVIAECCASEEGTQGHCAVGQICQNLQCVVEQVDSCQTDDDCPQGEICYLGVCAVQPTCTEDADCLAPAGVAANAPICCEGLCVIAECCMADEQTNPRCPEGTVCFEGVCDPVCKGDGDCESGSCCCPDGSCSADCCAGPQPTPEPTATGGSDSDDGVTLPSTGAGRNGGSGDTFVVAVAAGAAAVAAGALVRKRRVESSDS